MFSRSTRPCVTKKFPLLALNHHGRFERAESGVTTPLAARGVAFGDINNTAGWTLSLPLWVVPQSCFSTAEPTATTGSPLLSAAPAGNRDGYGARVDVNGRTRFASSAGSYVCANDKRLHFGLGDSQIATVDVSCLPGPNRS